MDFVDLASLPSTVDKPSGGGLAVLRPVAAEIGTPRVAFSSFDAHGYEVELGSPKTTPAGHWWRAAKFGLLLGGVFGGLVAFILVMIGLNMPSAPALLAAPVVPVVLVALATFAARPRRRGISMVVGDDGVDIGVIEGGPRKVTVRWDDETFGFLESRTHVFRVFRGVRQPTPTQTEVQWSIRRRGTFEPVVQSNCLWFHDEHLANMVGKNHRALAYQAMLRLGLGWRFARAQALLASGAPVTIGSARGKPVRLLPGAGAPILEIGSERTQRVDLRAGVYSFVTTGAPLTIPRDEVEDAFLIDALALGDSLDPLQSSLSHREPAA